MLFRSLRTKEEFHATALLEHDPMIRSDIVFFEGPAGGAVFSVGSISWFGALGRNGYDNDVATVTTNVIRRFLDPEPFRAIWTWRWNLAGAGRRGVFPPLSFRRPRRWPATRGPMSAWTPRTVSGAAST